MMKTSKGFMLFAFMNKEINYIQLSLTCAFSIKHNLKNNNITLVTDKSSKDWLFSNIDNDIIKNTFDNIIIKPEIKDDNRRIMNSGYYYKFETSFKNGNRFSAYELSPYDETIVLDVDFIVQTDNFDMVWNNNEDVMINKRAINLRYEKFHEKNIRLNSSGIDMYWATMIYFKKSEMAKILFDVVSYIKENYLFYKYLYDFPGTVYRNDYAFSIALHILSGFLGSTVKSFPIDTILTMDQVDDIVDIEINNILFLSNNTKEPYINNLCRIKNMDVHVMNKISIQNMFSKIFEIYKGNR